MGFAQIATDPDLRAKHQKQILDKYKTWDAWWNAQCDEFGTRLMNAMAGAKSETLAHKLDERLIESPVEQRFWDACKGRISGLEPQFYVGSYRIDFAVMPLKIAVEIDGHEYHSSVEQRTSDARRARHLQAKGWTVVRFTGSEVHADVERCVSELSRLVTFMEGSAS
jgi:very-short-patch-repair endonuclease